MKINEFLTEAYVDPEIVKILIGKGYKKIGKGVDQVVFLEPGTGLILKIFGTSKGGSGSSAELTDAQKSFKTFYDLSKADPGNEFLPQIMGYETFMFKDKPYLQIRMERLFEFGGRRLGPGSLGIEYWNSVLADMADAIERGEKYDSFWKSAFSDTSRIQPLNKRIRVMRQQEPMQQLVLHVGEEGLRKLWSTIDMLKRVAKKNGYTLDLHEGNFMLGSDGTPVISDPFFMGWGRST
jgi:hypothetical protein